MIRALRTALRFLTRVPVPGPPTAAGDLPAATVWFAPVGAGVGLLIGAAHVQLTGLWPAPVAAILAVAFGLLLTGALHEDASADAADALGGARDRESLRRILGDSRLGGADPQPLCPQVRAPLQELGWESRRRQGRDFLPGMVTVSGLGFGGLAMRGRARLAYPVALGLRGEPAIDRFEGIGGVSRNEIDLGSSLLRTPLDPLLRLVELSL